MKILLVEDNELNRDMLSRRLKRKGFTVLSAENGQEGIDVAISENPDIILMDLSLPVVDGWTAAGKLKSDASFSNFSISRDVAMFETSNP